MGRSVRRAKGRDAKKTSPGTAREAANGTSGKSPGVKDQRPRRLQQTTSITHPGHPSYSQPPTPPPTELRLIHEHLSPSSRHTSRTIAPNTTTPNRAVNIAAAKIKDEGPLAHLSPRLRAAVVSLSAQRAVERARTVTARVSRLRAAVDRLLARSPTHSTGSPSTATSSSADSTTRMRLKQASSRQHVSRRPTAVHRTATTIDSQASNLSRGSPAPFMRKPLPPPPRPEHLRSAFTVPSRPSASVTTSRPPNPPPHPPTNAPTPTPSPLAPLLPATHYPLVRTATPPAHLRNWNTPRVAGAQPLLPALMRAEKNASMAPELQELRCALQQYTWHGPYSARTVASKRTYASRTFPTPSAQFELAKVEGIWASPSSCYKRPIHHSRLGSPISDF